MASTYTKEEQEKLAQQQAANTNTSLAGSLGAATGTQTTTTAAPAKTDYMQRMNELATQKYVAGDNVTAAQSYLQSIIDNKPGAYQSKYADQLQGLYDRIMNREKFTYDLNGDMLYRQYADQYQQQGRMAMQDTMGQAEMMTGGYGNSYAQTAGQQVFQGYLQQLNNMVPELANAAYNRYAQEGADLQNQYALTQNADQADYAKYQDAYNQWTNDRNYAQSAYETAYSQDYTDYTNRLNLAQQTLQMEREDTIREHEEAYHMALYLLQMGKWPSAEVLAKSGMTEQDALVIAQKHGFGKEEKKSSGGGGSSKKSSGGGGGGGGDDAEDKVYAGEKLWQVVRDAVAKGPVQNNSSIYDQIINSNKLNR